METLKRLSHFFQIGNVVLHIARLHFTMSPKKRDHFYNEREKRHSSTSNIAGYALIGEIKAKVKITQGERERGRERKRNCPGNDAFTRHSSGSKTT